VTHTRPAKEGGCGRPRGGKRRRGGTGAGPPVFAHVRRRGDRRTIFFFFRGIIGWLVFFSGLKNKLFFFFFFVFEGKIGVGCAAGQTGRSRGRDRLCAGTELSCGRAPAIGLGFWFFFFLGCSLFMCVSFVFFLSMYSEEVEE